MALEAALCLASELANAIQTVNCNKEQCQLIGRRCDNLMGELLRLPNGLTEQLESRGIFSDLSKVLQSALNLCQEFVQKHWLKKVLNYR